MTFFSGGRGGGSDDVIVSDRLASENFSNPGGDNGIGKGKTQQLSTAIPCPPPSLGGLGYK